MKRKVKVSPSSINSQTRRKTGDQLKSQSSTSIGYGEKKNMGNAKTRGGKGTYNFTHTDRVPITKRYNIPKSRRYF